MSWWHINYNLKHLKITCTSLHNTEFLSYRKYTFCGDLGHTFLHSITYCLILTLFATSCWFLLILHIISSSRLISNIESFCLLFANSCIYFFKRQGVLRDCLQSQIGTVVKQYVLSFGFAFDEFWHFSKNLDTLISF